MPCSDCARRVLWGLESVDLSVQMLLAERVKNRVSDQRAAGARITDSVTGTAE